MSTFQNYITNPARLEVQSICTALHLDATSISFASNESTTLNVANEIAGAYEVLFDARQMQFWNLDETTAGPHFDAALSAMLAVKVALATYNATPPISRNLTPLQAACLSVGTPANTLLSDLNSASTTYPVMWSIQDRVYYEYSKAGEAELNDQLGQLGDALDQLSTVIDIVNTIEQALSVNPLSNTAGVSQVASDGTLSAGYATAASNSLMLTPIYGSTGQVNACQLVYQAFQQLKAIQAGFASGTTVYNAIGTVIADLNNCGVNTTWETAANPGSASIWTSTTTGFIPFWQNPNVRQDVNNLLTTLSSQNDIQKQTLRQAMFIYQEFIKSAALVMDRVYDAVKEIAGRIAR